MTTIYQIPIRRQSLPQYFVARLPSGSYTFYLTWNQYERTWNLDIDGVDGNPLIYGTPLVCGTNLMGQYKALGIGSLYIQNLIEPDANPTFDNLGTNVQLFTVSAT